MLPQAPATEFAPAKINLTLHVTGQRGDGYHLLDSLVVFAGVGDRIGAVAASGPTLVCDGPFSGDIPMGNDNLVLRAAQHLGVTGAAITLTKNLPPASGIGGGSADAAATIRALMRVAGCDPATIGAATLACLGADVPACFLSRPLRLRGIGEALTPLPADALPPAWLVLVNPRVEVPTPRVFAALTRRESPAMPDPLPTRWDDAAALASWLTDQRNDLQLAAQALQPVIGPVLAALTGSRDCLIARMSGSGATCFGLFAGPEHADAAASAIRHDHPDWWIAAAPMLGTR
ncbi:MAG: 4-(cytidine 5'-diphospho)-2-C-methyl-D-erythritol kinase [Gemmobacter sp.]